LLLTLELPKNGLNFENFESETLKIRQNFQQKKYQKWLKIGQKLPNFTKSSKIPQMSKHPHFCGIATEIRILRTIPHVWEHWLDCGFC